MIFSKSYQIQSPVRDEHPGGSPEDAPVGDDALEDVAGSPSVERGQRIVKQVEVGLKHF